METPPEKLGLYVSKLTLENVSCFRQRVEIPFEHADGKFAKWTILLGENGVGKSSVLRSLLWMEPVKDMQDGIEFLNNIKINLSGTKKDEGGISFTKWMLLNKLYYNFFLKIDFSFVDEKNEILIPYLDYQPVTLSASIDEVSDRNLRVLFGPKDLATQFLNFENDFSLVPIFGYGANRHYGTKSFSDLFKHHKAHSLFADEGGLFPAEEIILHSHNLSVNINSVNPHKQLFTKLVELLVGALIGLKDVKVEYDAQTTQPRVLALDAFNNWVPFSQISLGHQAMAAWLVDFAFRMLLFYPKSEDPFAEPAVCVVDEIDLHLHPKWQRKVFQFLEDRFPRTQFIVSAHSPLIVLSNPDANFVLLRNVDENDPSKGVEAIQDPIKVEGYRLDQLLSSELFGLSSTLDPITESEYLEKLNLQRRVTLGETLPPDESERLQALSDTLSEKGFSASSIDPLYNQFVNALLKRRKKELDSLADISAEEVDAVLAEILG